MARKLETLEESTLIGLAVAGNPESFTVLVDRHLAVIKGRIRSMVRNASDAEDLLQNVCLKAWRHLSSFRSDSSFRTWLTSIAINEALQLFRCERRNPISQLFDEFGVLVSPYESPDQRLDRMENTNEVHKAVMGLPEKYRHVLVLRDIRELSNKETAESLQLTVAAVKTRHLRARALLLASLQRTKVRQLRPRRVYAREIQMERKCA